MRRLLSIILVITLGIAACGSEKKDKERTVKVVVALADFQVQQGSLNGIQMALDEVNGKVGSTHVEIVSVTTSSAEESYSSDLETAAANQAAGDKDVVAYIGMATSGQAKAAVPILNKAGISSLSFTATWPGLTKTGFGAGEPGLYYPSGVRTFFRTVTSDEVQGAVGANLAKELGFTTACLLDDGQTYGAGVAGIFDLTANDLGIEIVCREKYDPTLASVEAYSEVAGRIVAANPDVVYLGGNVFEGAGEMIAALRQEKAGIPIIGPDGIVSYDESLSQYGADLVDGLYATNNFVPADQLGTELSAQFAAAYQQKYGEPPSPLAAAGYEAMRAVLVGIDKAGTPNRAGVVEALHNLGDYSGVLGSWTFDANGDTTLSSLCIWQIQDGTWKFVKRSEA